MRLDFDEVPSWRLLEERLMIVCTTMGLQIKGRVERRESAHGGLHVWFWLKRPLPASAIVALQAVLGSDWKREMFNLMRALVVDDAPDFWRERWNVLYSTKLEE